MGLICVEEADCLRDLELNVISKLNTRWVDDLLRVAMFILYSINIEVTEFIWKFERCRSKGWYYLIMLSLVWKIIWIMFEYGTFGNGWMNVYVQYLMKHVLWNLKLELLYLCVIIEKLGK